MLVRLGDFYAAAFSELRKKAARLAWEKYIVPGQRVALRVTCHKSRLYHSDAVAERILGAIGDRLGSPVSLAVLDEDAAGVQPQLVVVRLSHDLVTISIDSSGEHLHRRGYRLASAKAPLRENLAAGLILASGWDRESPLIDPFCGSGTIPIEAAVLARGMVPGRKRRFSFMDWPDFELDLWDTLRKKMEAETAHRYQAEDPASMEQAAPIILGSDRDAGAVSMAEENTSRAGVSRGIQFACQAFSAIDPPAKPGWVVSNPPYGLRLSHHKDLRNLYAQLGNVLRQKCPGWHYAILCSDPKLFSNSGLSLESRLSFVNGGVPVRLYCGTIPK